MARLILRALGFLGFALIFCAFAAFLAGCSTPTWNQGRPAVEWRAR